MKGDFNFLGLYNDFKCICFCMHYNMIFEESYFSIHCTFLLLSSYVWYMCEIGIDRLLFGQIELSVTSFILHPSSKLVRGIFWHEF